MLFFEDYNFAYFHVNKTAGTTIKAFLRQVLKGPVQEIGWLSHSSWKPGNLTERPAKLDFIHEHLGNKIRRFKELGIDFDSLTILTTIRNPYDRWVSLYTVDLRNITEKRIKVGLRAVYAEQFSFDVWLEDYVLKGVLPDRSAQQDSQSAYLLIENPLGLTAHIPNNVNIIRAEDVDIELPKFLEKELGIKTDLQLPRKNVSNHMRDKDTMGYYPEHLRKIVYDLDKYIIDKYYPEFKYEG